MALSQPWKWCLIGNGYSSLVRRKLAVPIARVTDFGPAVMLPAGILRSISHSWPVERWRNALQFTYLMTWWRHSSVTIHVTKFYFIQLVLRIKYVEFEDGPKFFIKIPLEMWKFFCQKTDKRIFYLKIWKYENWMTCCKRFEQLVRSNALWWLTSKCAAYMSF